MWLILGSSAAFSCNDACLKALGAEQPIFEAIMWRGCAVTAVLVGCAWRQGHLHDGIQRRDAMLIGLIAGAEVITLFSFLYALLRLPLGQVIAIQQSLPVVQWAVAVGFLGERFVGWRACGVGLAFGGVIMLTQPTAANLGSASLIAGVSVLSMTARDLLARRLSPNVSSVLPAASAALGVTIAAGIASATEPRFDPTPTGVALLVGSALSLTLGSVLGMAAVRTGELGFVAPFRYTALLFATAIGFVVFGEVPDAVSVAGGALVVIGGLATLFGPRSFSVRC